MSNRLATVSAEDVDLVVKIVDWVLIQEIIAPKEAVVVGDLDTEGCGVCIHLGRASKQRNGRHSERYCRGN